jgi:chemotaxis protein methyltransferase CheR
MLKTLKLDSRPPAPALTELDLVRSLLATRSGIDFGRHRLSFLESRVRRRMSQVGARSLYEYYRMVAASEAGELQALVDEVSIHETSFFRNPPQFAMLASHVLRERVSARLAHGVRALRLWSAGCSTGQEPYSLAMVLIESVVVTAAWDVRVLASDISAQAVAHAGRAAYAATQLDGLDEIRLQRFFERRGDVHVVRAWLHRLVSFSRANLLDEPPATDLDVVFCRNVMIYFDRERQRQLVARLAASLAPGGFLFLGHTESLSGLSDAFQMVSHGRGIAYRKKE